MSFVSFTAFADAVSSDQSSLASLIQFGIENSLDGQAMKSDVRFQQANQSLANRTRLIPQVTLSAAYQRLNYDRPVDNGTGTLVSNDGHNTNYSVLISYDLQKFFGPESALAEQATYFSKLQHKIAIRDIVRNIKKSFFTIREIQFEIDELKKLVGLYDRINGVLHRQSKSGVYNELERQQFQVQQSIFNNDLLSREADLEAAYFQLSSLINVEIAPLKQRVGVITKPVETKFISSPNLDPDRLAGRDDKDMIVVLGRDYDLAKLEYQKYNSLPLPTVYVRGAKDSPTPVSADGPQTTAEVGISIPLDAFATRPAQKSMLAAKSEKSQLLKQKALQDYRNQIKLDVSNLNRLKSQAVALEKTRTETKKLLDKSFLFYSQKRLDVLGTMDIFQKYLQAAKNSLMNEYQMQITDAELEYLVGAPQ